MHIPKYFLQGIYFGLEFGDIFLLFLNNIGRVMDLFYQMNVCTFADVRAYITDVANEQQVYSPR